MRKSLARRVRALSRGVAIVVVMALVVIGSVATAWAQEVDLDSKLDQAEQFIQEEPLNFREAQRLLFEVVRSGQGTAEQMARAYFTLGRVEAALEHSVESSDSFYLAMMIQPSLFLPEGSSPKVVSRLNEARNRVIEVGVLEATLSLDGGVLEVHLDNDPLDLVEGIEVSLASGEEAGSPISLEKTRPRVEVAAGVTSIQVVLLDELGNQLKALELDPADAQASADINPALVNRGPSIWQDWRLWTGVAGVLAVGGTYFTLESGNIQSDADSAEDDITMARLTDDKDRVALYGLVGFSLAGAAAVTAGWFLITGGDEAGSEAGSDEAADVAFLPSVGPGQVGAELSVSF